MRGLRLTRVRGVPRASEALRFGVTLQDAVKSVHDDRNVDPLRSDQIRGSRTRGSPG